MPVFRTGKGNAPTWCELENFEFIVLKPGEMRSLPRSGEKEEEIIVCSGQVHAVSGEQEAQLATGEKMDLTSSAEPGFVLTANTERSLVLRLLGHWQSVTSSGVFTTQNGEPPTGDTPYAYKKLATFDNHYHDCDEYWIFFSGHCRVASEGKIYEVDPGDCLVTGRGWHHDILSVMGETPARAVWFEGTLEGQQRTGHLWEPRDGKAMPCAERV